MKIPSCAFCGKDPIVEDDDGAIMVTCANMDCIMYDLPRIGVNAWQQRHYPPEVTAVIEAAKKLRHSNVLSVSWQNLYGECMNAVRSLEEMEASK